MAYTKIAIERRGCSAVIAIDNPPVNALHPVVSGQILAALGEVSAMAGIRGIVLTGRGRNFVAGGDIEFFPSLDRGSARSYALGIQAMQAALGEIDLPVIAAVNGYALGGGCELMMACDIRVAEASASFGQPEARLGLIPGAGGTQNLPRLVPLGQAKRMLFTGCRIGAERALALGLVDEVVPDGQGVDAALAIVDEIAECAPLAVAQAKRAVNQGLAMSVADGHRLEAGLFADLFSTEDLREGVQAFLEKREPVFKAR